MAATAAGYRKLLFAEQWDIVIRTSTSRYKVISAGYKSHDGRYVQENHGDEPELGVSVGLNPHAVRRIEHPSQGTVRYLFTVPLAAPPYYRVSIALYSLEVAFPIRRAGRPPFEYIQDVIPPTATTEISNEKCIAPTAFHTRDEIIYCNSGPVQARPMEQVNDSLSAVHSYTNRCLTGAEAIVGLSTIEAHIRYCQPSPTAILIHNVI